MKHEYHEGPQALDRFKQGMLKLFQIKKEQVITVKPTPKRKASKG
jgi:hypothetical protein